MNKKELRALYIEKRLMLSEEDYHDRNQKLVEVFFNEIDLSGVKVIHVFLPMVKYKEPDTWPIIKRIQAEKPSIRFSIPKVNNKSKELENFYFDSPDQLKENKWGILEPQFGDKTDHVDIDMVLVPLLVCDKSGQRVGYGKGYYDKMLALTKPNCLKIGVSLFPPIDSINGVDKFDVALDYCLVPDDAISFLL